MARWGMAVRRVPPRQSCAKFVIKYFSESDDVEQWFEAGLSSRLKVDFMGPVLWFLGCCYEWSRDEEGNLSVHISQEVYVNQLLDRFGMTDCNPARDLPYHSGLVMDRIPCDGRPPGDKPELGPTRGDYREIGSRC